MNHWRSEKLSESQMNLEIPPFPSPGQSNLRKILRSGDAILTYGHSSWSHFWPPWPPWRPITEGLGKALVYHFIRSYQKGQKDGRGRPLYPYHRATHIRFCLGENLLWEVTTPEAQFTDFSVLDGKELTICRPLQMLDLEAMLAEAQRITRHEGVYDIPELLSFGLSGLLGVHRKRILRFDKGRRYVCSTGAGRVYAIGGQDFHPIKWPDIPPAWYENRPNRFARYKIRKAVLG